MKTKILTIDGKSKGEIVLPKIFSVKIGTPDQGGNEKGDRNFNRFGSHEE